MSKYIHPNTKHGMRHTRFYRIWVGMKTRCTNTKHTWFKHYGGRGISVSDEWLDFPYFKNDMHKSYIEHVKKHGEKNTTLERIDSNGNYCKSNCRWATREEQSRNARNNIYITYKGQRKPLWEWASITGIAYATLHARIFKYKLDLDDAFTPKRDFKNRPRKKKTL